MGSRSLADHDPQTVLAGGVTARIWERIPAFRALGGSIATGVALQGTLLVTGILAARLLGPDDRGRLALLILVPSLIAQIGGLGLPLAVTQFVAAKRASTRQVVRVLSRAAVVQTAVLTAIHAVVVLALIRSYHGLTVGPAAITLLTIPAQFALGYPIAILQGQRRFALFNVLRFAPTAGYGAALGGAAGAGDASLLLVATLATVPFAVASVIALLVLWRDLRGTPDEPVEPEPTLREMLGFGLRGMLGSLSPVDTFRLDQLIVASLFAPGALGIYVVGAAFMNLTRFIGQSIGMVAAPHVASQPDPAARKRAMWRLTGLGLAICTATSVVLAVAIPTLVRLLFGSQFAAAAPVGQILIAAALLLSLRRVLTDAARGAGRPGVGAAAEVVALATMPTLLIATVPPWGLRGVAVALTASAAAGALALAFLLSSRGEHLLPRLADAALDLWRNVRGQTLRTALLVLFCSGAAIGSGAAITAGGSAGFILALEILALLVVTVGSVLLSCRRGDDILSPLGLGAIFYLAVFGLGAAYFATFPVGTRYVLLYDGADLRGAVALAILAWIGFAAGYLLVQSRVRGDGVATPISESVRGAGPVAVPVALLLAVGWLARLALIASGRYFHAAASGAASSSSSGWWLATASAFPTLALSYLGATVYLSPQPSPARRRAFRLLVGVEILWAVPSGTRASLAALGLTLIALRYYGTGRFPWRATTLFLAVLVFVIMPLGLVYRDTTYQNDPRGALHGTMRVFAHQGIAGAYSSGFAATLSRLSPVASVAVVLHNPSNPSHVSYETTMRQMLGVFVPRAFMHEKTDPGLYGNAFGRSYGILRENDYVTSIAPTEVSEVYLIGGVLGIVAIMPFVGAAYGLLNCLLLRRSTQPLPLALYAISAWSLLNQHGVVLALGVAGTMKTLGALAIALGCAVRIGRLGRHGYLPTRSDVVSADQSGTRIGQSFQNLPSRTSLRSV